MSSCSDAATSLTLRLEGEFPGGMVNKSYYSNAVRTNISDTLSWEVLSGDLPPGLVLSKATDSGRAWLRGTPTTEGSYKFTLQVTWKEQTQSKDFTIKIDPDENEEKSKITGEFPDGTVGAEYDSDRDVSFTWGDLTGWEVVSGDLPPGLILRSYRPEAIGAQTKYAELRGTPTKAGTYTFTAKATSNAHKEYPATKTFTVVIYAQIAISNQNWGNATVGTAYGGYMTVTGGKAPYTWTCRRGNLPAGLELDFDSVGKTCKFSGTPTTEGTSTFWIQVTDSTSSSETKVLSITVAKRNDNNNSNTNNGNGGGGGGCESVFGIFTLALAAFSFKKF